MVAYKFLADGRRAPFSGVVWPEVGQWIEAEGPPAECRNGIHACRVEDLPYWLGPELWQVELDGPVGAGTLKLVAARGRLTARVDAWDEAAQRAFAEDCMRRTAATAADALREAGLADAAERVAGEDDVTALAAAAGAAEQDAQAAGASDAALILAYVDDIAQSLDEFPASVIAYVAAHAADMHGSAMDSDAFAAERSAQAGWLAERLGLLSP